MDEWDGKERRRGGGIHFDATVNIGHIISTVIVVVSGVWWAAGIDKRLAVDESKLESIARHSEHVEAQLNQAILENNQKLDRINEKIDRLIERGAR